MRRICNELAGSQGSCRRLNHDTTELPYATPRSNASARSIHVEVLAIINLLGLLVVRGLHSGAKNAEAGAFCIVPKRFAAAVGRAKGH